MKDSSTDNMISAKVAHDWNMLKHVPEKKQTTDVCMSAIIQNWQATKFVVKNNPELASAVWDLYKDNDNENLSEVFKWVILGLGYEEYKHTKSKPANTKKEMEKIVSGLKGLANASLTETAEVIESTSKTVKKAKSKLSSLLLNKGKISSLLKKDRK